MRPFAEGTGCCVYQMGEGYVCTLPNYMPPVASRDRHSVSGVMRPMPPLQRRRVVLETVAVGSPRSVSQAPVTACSTSGYGTHVAVPVPRAQARTRANPPYTTQLRPTRGGGQARKFHPFFGGLRMQVNLARATHVQVSWNDRMPPHWERFLRFVVNPESAPTPMRTMQVRGNVPLQQRNGLCMHTAPYWQGPREVSPTCSPRESLCL